MIHATFASFGMNLLVFILIKSIFAGSNKGLSHVYRGCDFKRSIGWLLLIGRHGAGAK